jgi:hypothetical protein
LDFFSRLQELSLRLDHPFFLDHLAHCNQLRVLRLIADSNTRITTQAVCAVIAANAATLEELRLCHWISRSAEPKYNWPAFATIVEANPNDPDDVAAMEHWSVLADCPRLRILEVPIKNEVAPQLLAALTKAPAFQALELSLPPRLYPQSPPLLQSALASATWCSIRFLYPDPQLRNVEELESFMSAAGATQEGGVLPSSVALRRLCVITRRAVMMNERCFMLRSTAEGSLEWQQEY